MMVAKGFSKKLKLNIKSIKIDVSGEMDKNKSKGFSLIKTTYYIDTDDSEKQINKFINLIEKYCPVKLTITDSPEFETEIKII
ncbi:OsmC family protein [Miniphocaeibacter halophilus]|uniref:OsmC family protein n=1 Tax=Miniphocaeibacter halophilus TaxID=2931922 RepID=A0AC61MQS1_9FIRM|nr:OsmC family protein [Miniphocaeibacter halophilus]QQK08030.1 OsmC family protein [Miniphocaeibacter halophilus]